MNLLLNAVMLSALVFALTDSFKRAVPGTLPPVVVQAVAFAIGIGAVFLVGASVWAHSEVIAKVPLSDMNTASKLVAGLLIGAGATLLDRFVFVQSRGQDG